MKRLILIIFFVLIVIRFINLTADLPVARTEIAQNIGEFYYDEGWWSLGIRDLLLFNDPDHSHFNTIALSPISSLIYFIFFKVFGMNLISLKLIGVFSSLVAIYLFFKISKKGDPKNHLLALALFGFNSLFLIYSKTGLLEIICLPLLLAAYTFYLNRYYVLTGIVIGLAVLTKVHTIFFLIVLMIFPRRFKVLLGFLIVFIPWFTLIIKQPVLAHYQSDRWLTSGNPIVNMVKSLFIGLIYRDTFFRNNPLFFIFALISIPGLYRKDDQISKLFFWWAVIGCLFFGLFPFQPARYFVLLLPPLTFALVKGNTSDNRFLVTIVAIVVVSQVVFGILRPFADAYHGPISIFPPAVDYKLAAEVPRFLRTFDLSLYPDLFARLMIYVFFSAFALFVGVLVGLIKWQLFRPVKVIIPFIIVVDLFLNSWVLNPSYSFLKFGRRLEIDVKGKIAPAGTFSLINNLDYENLPVLKRNLNDPNLFPEYALLITKHPLLGRFHDARFLQTYRPVIFYSLFNGRYEVTLYEEITNSSRSP